LPGVVRSDFERFCNAVAPDVTRELLRQLDVDETPEALLAKLRAGFGVRAQRR
jgi:hypothetical protein